MSATTLTTTASISRFVPPGGTSIDPSPHSAAAAAAMIPQAAQSQPSSQQSFTMSQQSQAGLAAPTYRAFADPSASRMGANDAPQIIYSAIYSGVDVYEMEVHGVAVMRRRNDSWLNATQILKVAGVDKGKRTKILEKEIQTGEHEKVQGGYGKYQGTWIKFDRGVEVCRQYGVEEILRPLLTYDMGQDGGVAGRGDINTPTKEQAMAAQRKRMYNASQESRVNGTLSGTTFFKNISSTASHAVAALSKARYDSPGPRSRNGPVPNASGGAGSHSAGGVARAPSFSRQTSMQGLDTSGFPGNSQESYASDYGQPPTQNTVDYVPSSQQSTVGQPSGMPDLGEPPRKRARVTLTPADSFGYPSNMDMYATTFPGSPTEPNESFVYSQAALGLGPELATGDNHGPLPPLPYEVSPEAEQKRGLLMKLFMESGDGDHVNHDIIRSMNPTELDAPIDAQSHTALHWAATLARMPLLRALILAGASPYRVNAMGETALMRSCVVTNSMECSTFPDLLEMLGGTIEARDIKGRTVLHHIAVTSAVKGRNQASKYYLESLLEWVVRQGSSGGNSLPSSQQQQAQAQTNGGATTNGANGSAPTSSQSQSQHLPRMGIARFMTEIVNAQDNSGDTALNIAARIGNRSIISQLLEVGADPQIGNRAGLRPLDFGVGGGEAMVDHTAGPNGDASQGTEKNGSTNNQRSRESSDEIITSITHLLNETATSFSTDMKTKQAAVDSLHAALRTTSSQLGEARRHLEALQARAKKQQLARQKVANLSHAREDEQLRLAQEPAAPVTVSSAWETELSAVLEAAGNTATDGVVTNGMNGEPSNPNAANDVLLPSTAVLRARIAAVAGRREATRKMVQALKGRSRDVEMKYRRVVALSTGVPEDQVEAVVDGLLRAVESEKGDLELGRVRRFLGGVEGVVH